PTQPRQPARLTLSMRPGADAPEAEIVGVGLTLHLAGRRLAQPVRNAVALGIGHSFVLGGEFEQDLGARVARRRPAHQWINLAPLARLVLEDPFLGAGRAGLHSSAGGLVDAGDHDVLRLAS